MQNLHKSILAIGMVFAFVQIIGMVIAERLFIMDTKAFADPNNVAIPFYYLIAAVLLTVFIIWMIRRNMDRVLERIWMVLTVFLLFTSLVILIELFVGTIFVMLALPLAISLAYILFKTKKWYLQMMCAIMLAVVMVGTFGASITPLVAIVFLTIFAVYDYISVYVTKSMQKIISPFKDSVIPIFIQMPLEGKKFDSQNNPIKRTWRIVGLGDIIIPGFLIASTVHLPRDSMYFLTTNTWLGLFIMLGSIIGISTCLLFVDRKGTQAGLPFLNTSAISAYVIGYVLLYRDLSLGVF